MPLMVYDPTRGYMVSPEQARVVAYVVDTDTGVRYSTLAAAQAAQSKTPIPTPPPTPVSEPVATPATYASVRAKEAADAAATRPAMSDSAADAAEKARVRQMQEVAKVANQAPTPAPVPAPESRTDAAADAAEKAKVKQMQEVAKTANQATPNTLANSLTALQASVAASKEAVAKAEENIKAAEADKAVAVQAQIDAARNAGAVAAQTGSTINPQTGMIVPNIALSVTPSISLPPTVVNVSQTTDPAITNLINLLQQQNAALMEQFGAQTTDPAITALIQQLQAQNQQLMSSLGKQDAAAEQARKDAAAAAEAVKKEKTENAITSLTSLFNRYGLASLVPRIKDLAISGASESTITLQLAESPEYKMRFKANEARLKKGLAVLEPGDYINLEDDYRQILRAYGLKQFDNDEYVTQFISNDIATTELTNRVVTAVQRVQNADPTILTTLRSFYGISDNDLVAYVLDPNNQFQKIERQVAAAEIGAAAGVQGLKTGVAVAEQLAAQGITKAQAQKGYATIADILPTAEKLSDIYKGTEDEYRQAEAEQEVFNTLASAQRKRTKLAQRELAAFSGSAGLGKSSLTSQLGGTF